MSASTSDECFHQAYKENEPNAKNRKLDIHLSYTRCRLCLCSCCFTETKGDWSKVALAGSISCRGSDASGSTELFWETSQHYDISFYWEHLLSRWYPAYICWFLWDFWLLSRFLGSKPNCSKFRSNKLDCKAKLLTLISQATHLMLLCLLKQVIVVGEEGLCLFSLLSQVNEGERGVQSLFRGIFPRIKMVAAK